MSLRPAGSNLRIEMKLFISQEIASQRTLATTFER
jgi:hypothetical protein